MIEALCSEEGLRLLERGGILLLFLLFLGGLFVIIKRLLVPRIDDFIEVTKAEQVANRNDRETYRGDVRKLWDQQMEMQKQQMLDSADTRSVVKGVNGTLVDVKDTLKIFRDEAMVAIRNFQNQHDSIKDRDNEMIKILRGINGKTGGN